MYRFHKRYFLKRFSSTLLSIFFDSRVFGEVLRAVELGMSSRESSICFKKSIVRFFIYKDLNSSDIEKLLKLHVNLFRFLTRDLFFILYKKDVQNEIERVT